MLAGPAYPLSTGPFPSAPGEDPRSRGIEDRTESALDFLARIRLRVIDPDLKHGKTLL